MIETKFFEIRDNGTCIPVIALKCQSGQTEATEREDWLLRRAGFGENGCIMLVKIETNECSYDPYGWQRDSRTIPNAHAHIEANWDALKTGDLIDVRVILGESETPCASDQDFEFRRSA